MMSQDFVFPFYSDTLTIFIIKTRDNLIKILNRIYIFRITLAIEISHLITHKVINYSKHIIYSINLVDEKIYLFLA